MSKARAEKKALPKKFFERATLEPVSGGFRVLLDGRELKTQGRRPLVVASAGLAEAIVAEWNAQREVIDPDQMPLTRLVNLAIDRAGEERAAYAANILAYAGTDLLCYRDPAIAERQAALFDPVLDWAAQAHGIRLQHTDAVTPIPQPQASLDALARLLATASDVEITALAMMVPLLGSALLGVAVWQGHLSPEGAIVAARVDEEAQAERWGRDPEAEAAWQYKQKDIAASAFFLTFKAL